MSINEVPRPDQEITKSEKLRDTLWQHLPSIARVCSGTVKVEYLTSEPAGFLQVMYEPENGELDVVYTELIYEMSPIIELLVGELVNRVPKEQSVFKNIQPGDIPARNSSRKARQVYCSMDGETGEISVYAETLGILNDHGIVEDERDIAASMASTPEESLSLYIFGPTVTDPDLTTLAHTMNIFNNEKHNALLKVFEQI
jgi:hypothetical protein